MKTDLEENVSQNMWSGSKVDHFSGKMQSLSLLGCSEERHVQLASWLCSPYGHSEEG